jgi:hypothetical protein
MLKDELFTSVIYDILSIHGFMREKTKVLMYLPSVELF